MKKLHSLALEQKEDAKHGEAFFPVQRYITKLTPDYPVVTTHWHEEAELTLIKEGKCLYQIDLVDYEVKKGIFCSFRRCFCIRFLLAGMKKLFPKHMYFI